jgi:hypothetical protein
MQNSVESAQTAEANCPFRIEVTALALLSTRRGFAIEATRGDCKERMSYADLWVGGSRVVRSFPFRVSGGEGYRTMNLPPPGTHQDRQHGRDGSRVIPIDQKSDSHRHHRGVEQPRCGVPHLPFMYSHVSKKEARKKYRLDKNPAYGRLRTIGCRNFPTTMGLPKVPRHGDDRGDSLSAEVRQATAVWTHTHSRSSCCTSCRVIGERFVPMTPPADRHHTPLFRCVWGAPIGCSTTGLPHCASRPSAALSRRTILVTVCTTQNYPTYLACGVCRLSAPLLHRVRPTR